MSNASVCPVTMPCMPGLFAMLCLLHELYVYLCSRTWTQWHWLDSHRYSSRHMDIYIGHLRLFLSNFRPFHSLCSFVQDEAVSFFFSDHVSFLSCTWKLSGIWQLCVKLDWVTRTYFLLLAFYQASAERVKRALIVPSTLLDSISYRLECALVHL